jgi:hypothetical protein
MKFITALMSLIATPVSALDPRATEIFGQLKRLSQTAGEISKLPVISINLMLSGTQGNDPFYQEITRRFHQNATRRHHKFPLVRQLEYGVAVCLLKDDPRAYSHRLGSTAQRNLKKALRLGYRFARIDYNQHLNAVTDIHRSAKIRQGQAMPKHFFSAKAPSIVDPPSRNPLHDYPYFGIFKNDVLVAYASCLIAGDLCAIETIYGHVDYHADGIIPLLLVSMGDYLIAHHPQVRYYAYDTYYGASETMKRLKRKFLFHPHRVSWKLD